MTEYLPIDSQALKAPKIIKDILHLDEFHPHFGIFTETQIKDTCQENASLCKAFASQRSLDSPGESN